MKHLSPTIAMTMLCLTAPALADGPADPYLSHYMSDTKGVCLDRDESKRLRLLCHEATSQPPRRATPAQRAELARLAQLQGPDAIADEAGQ